MFVIFTHSKDEEIFKEYQWEDTVWQLQESCSYADKCKDNHNE